MFHTNVHNQDRPDNLNHKKYEKKYFLRRLSLSRFLTKTFKSNAMKSFSNFYLSVKTKHVV